VISKFSEEPSTFDAFIEDIFIFKKNIEEDKKLLSLLPQTPREQRMAVKQLLQYCDLLLRKNKLVCILKHF
jgi:hypothetical protein